MGKKKKRKGRRKPSRRVPSRLDKKPTLDADESARLRDEAMRKVDEAALEAWKAEADSAIEEAAQLYDVFTSDQVWEILDGRDVPRPREPRGMGPRVTDAMNRRVIEPTGGFRRSERPETHRNPKAVYRPYHGD